VRVARTLAPVGYQFASADLVRAVVGGVGHARERELEPGLRRLLRVRSAPAVSSGKAAMTLVLLALARLTGRRKVVIPAYTCYSVPSSIVKAGLEVVPCDLAEGSFDYDYTRLAPMLQGDILCVVSVHLFGIPADTARLMQLCRGAGIFVVEDAAQALGGQRHGQALGTLGDVGVFSLGRGKNITSGSGGVIVTDSDQIAESLTAVTRDLPGTPWIQDVATFATLLTLSWFILPRLYWLPAGLPFLRLGETIFHEDFPVRWLSDFQARLLSDWPARLAALDSIRREHSEYYLRHLDVFAEDASVRSRQPAGPGVALLRFPLLLEPGLKQPLLAEERGVRLGMSGMYPATVAAIPQLAGRLPQVSFPRAEAVADTLVTLPTHPLVSEADRAAICARVNDAGRRRQRTRRAS
jgi:dTDP-4-amino-4,6-dideoxygalactose transaminase